MEIDRQSQHREKSVLRIPFASGGLSKTTASVLGVGMIKMFTYSKKE